MGLLDLVLTLGGGMLMGVVGMPAQVAMLITGLLVAWFSAREAFLAGDWYVTFLTMLQWPIESFIGWGMGAGLGSLTGKSGNVVWILTAGLLFALWLHFLFFPPIMHPVICGILDLIDVSRPRCVAGPE